MYICIYVSTQIYRCGSHRTIASCHLATLQLYSHSLGNPVSHSGPTSCSAAKPDFVRCIYRRKKGKLGMPFCTLVALAITPP